MDYKKTNAPATTVTRDMMDSVPIQEMFMKLLLLLVSVLTRSAWKSRTTFLRNWQSLLLTMITWKKYLRIESKSKFLVIMRSCRNRTWLLRKNTSKGKYIIEIRQRKRKNFSNLFSDERIDSQVVSGKHFPIPYCLAIIV